jgi:transposase
MQVTTIGLDLAKNVFQVHGIDDHGEVAFNRVLTRAQVLAFFERLEPSLVGIEACGTSHHWARELIKLGHNVKLIQRQIIDNPFQPIVLVFLITQLKHLRWHQTFVFFFQLKYVAGLILALRQIPATAVPSLPCFTINAFCASVNLDAFIASTPSSSQENSSRKL